MAFTPARYAALPTPALTHAHFNLLTALFDSLPPNDFEEDSHQRTTTPESDDEPRPLFIYDSDPAASLLPGTLDARTLKRLSRISLVLYVYWLWKTLASVRNTPFFAYLATDKLDTSMSLVLSLETLYARTPLTMAMTSSWESPLIGRLLSDVSFGLPRGSQDADGDISRSGTTGLGGMRYTWEEVREKVNNLVAIHLEATVYGPDHWLVSTQIDIHLLWKQRCEIRGATNIDENACIVTMRQIARLAPCLGILHNILFSISFSTRITIHRERIAQDGFDRLRDVDLKGRIDKLGAEAGMTAVGFPRSFHVAAQGGLRRGLWLVIKKMCLALFLHEISLALLVAHNLNWYRFIGRIIGKATYGAAILVDIAASWTTSIRSTRAVQLDYLQYYIGNAEVSLNFIVVVEGRLGITTTVDLISK
ncbi:hypothetical protein B0H13DRAFT_2318437 [Mycena leptocephala]|nr:hypothetical protein B0H13DRAFT_2318437 [Mycena leptocephala]